MDFFGSSLNLNVGTNVTAADLRRFANEAAAKYLRKEASLNSAVKSAMDEYGLNAEQTKRVAEFANHATFKSLMAEETEPEKIIKFPVADVSVILGESAKVASFSNPLSISIEKTAHFPAIPTQVDVIDVLFGKRDYTKEDAEIQKQAELRQAEKTYLALGDVESQFKEHAVSAAKNVIAAEDKFKQAAKELFLSGESTPAELAQIVNSLGGSKYIAPVMADIGASGYHLEIGRPKLASLRVNPEHPIAEAYQEIVSNRVKLAKLNSVIDKIAADKKMCMDKLLPKKKVAAPVAKTAGVASWAKNLGTKAGLLEEFTELKKPTGKQVIDAFSKMTKKNVSEIMTDPDLQNGLRNFSPIYEAQETTEKLRHKLTTPGKILGGVVAGSAAAGIAHGVGNIHDKIVETKDKNKGFKNLMKLNPDLHDVEPATLKRHFDVLYKLSPTAATTPDIAASWLRTTTHSNSGLDAVTAKQAIDLEAAHNSSKTNKGRVSGSLRALPLFTGFGSD